MENPFNDLFINFFAFSLVLGTCIFIIVGLIDKDLYDCLFDFIKPAFGSLITSVIIIGLVCILYSVFSVNYNKNCLDYHRYMLKEYKMMYDEEIDEYQKEFIKIYKIDYEKILIERYAQRLGLEIKNDVLED